MATKSAAAHFHKFYAAEHEFTMKMAEGHRAQLKKAESAEDIAYHESAITAYTAKQFFLSKAMSETRKAMEDDELHKGELIPTQVSAIADPSKVPAGVRAVIRNGQRQIPGSGDMPVVDQKFEHLIKVE